MTENKTRKGLRKIADEISKGTEDMLTEDIFPFKSFNI